MDRESAQNNQQQGSAVFFLFRLCSTFCLFALARRSLFCLMVNPRPDDDAVLPDDEIRRTTEGGSSRSADVARSISTCNCETMSTIPCEPA